MNSKFRLVAAAAGLSLATVIVEAGTAHADPTPPCNNGTGLFTTECGAGSTTGTADFATAVGAGSNAGGNASVAVGSNTTAGEGATALGTFSTASGFASIAIGSGATASASNSVAIGSEAQADRPNTVSVGQVALQRQIVNVAAGTEATDAVNLGQMQAADTALQSQVTSNTTNITAVTAATSTMGADISDLQSSVGTLFDLRQADRQDMRQGVASAMAMGNASMPSQPGRVSYSVNGARFRGENAVGGSMMYRLNTASPMAIGGAFSVAGHKNNGARVSVAGEF